MIAIGYTNKGDIKEFIIDSDGILRCSNKDLVSIEIPKGVKEVLCHNNKIKELNIPEGVKEIYCDENLLTELYIPKSIILLICDRSVKGLENINWNCKIILL